MRWSWQPSAFVASVLLHGLALALLVLLVPFGMQGREGYQHFLPVEVVEAGIEARRGTGPQPGVKSQREAHDTAPSVPSGAEAKPVDGYRSPDPLRQPTAT
jgi:hypothetical protein